MESKERAYLLDNINALLEGHTGKNVLVLKHNGSLNRRAEIGKTRCESGIPSFLSGKITNSL